MDKQPQVGGRGYFVSRHREEPDYFSIHSSNTKVVIIVFDRPAGLANREDMTRNYYFNPSGDEHKRHTISGYLTLRGDGNWVPRGIGRLYSGDSFVFE